MKQDGSPKLLLLLGQGLPKNRHILLGRARVHGPQGYGKSYSDPDCETIRLSPAEDVGVRRSAEASRYSSRFRGTGRD